MSMISLEMATKIAQTAYAEGAARNVVNMSVVITDAGGHVRLAMRADGQGIFGVDIAKAKAVTALGFGRNTSLMGNFEAAAVAGLSGATGGRFLPIGGGVLVRDTAGTLLGAAAVAGGAPAVDEEIIIAAVEAAGLNVVR